MVTKSLRSHLQLCLLVEKKRLHIHQQPTILDTSNTTYVVVEKNSQILTHFTFSKKL